MCSGSTRPTAVVYNIYSYYSGTYNENLSTISTKLVSIEHRNQRCFTDQCLCTLLHMLKAPDSAQNFETAQNKILRHFDVNVMKLNLHSLQVLTSCMLVQYLTIIVMFGIYNPTVMFSACARGCVSRLIIDMWCSIGANMIRRQSET